MRAQCLHHRLFLSSPPRSNRLFRARADSLSPSTHTQTHTRKGITHLLPSRCSLALCLHFYFSFFLSFGARNNEKMMSREGWGRSKQCYMVTRPWQRWHAVYNTCSEVFLPFQRWGLASFLRRMQSPSERGDLLRRVWLSEFRKERERCSFAQRKSSFCGGFFLFRTRGWWLRSDWVRRHVCRWRVGSFCLISMSLMLLISWNWIGLKYVNM